MATSWHAIMELHWLVSFTASCIHAAEAVAHGRLIADARLAEAVAEPAQVLRQAIVAAGLPRATFWRHLAGLSVITDNAEQLAERALVKTVGASRSGVTGAEVAAAIRGLEAAVRRDFPTLLDDLSLRTRPIREQWEAHGPGLLHILGRWTDPRLIVSQAEVVLVHPALGGGGSAHLPYNNVLIEAVLANPVAELPEFLRLGWLLSQLNLDLPAYSESMHVKRLPHVAELAMLPPALKAAEELDLLQLTPDTIDLALKSWYVATPTDLDPVDVLWRWWTTYVDTQSRWDVALTALDRMCG